MEVCTELDSSFENDILRHSLWIVSRKFSVAGQRWGRADDFRYNCCFIWLDLSLCELDRYVEERVDKMMESGLLDEVYGIYDPNADYTRGLKQAIGVREFEKLFKSLFSCSEKALRSVCRDDCQPSKVSLLGVIQDSNDNNLKNLLNEAIEELKTNTRRLVRRQVSSITSISQRSLFFFLFSCYIA